jgi:hypothetical protein
MPSSTTVSTSSGFGRAVTDDDVTSNWRVRGLVDPPAVSS